MIDRITIAVDGMDPMVAFYSAILGMTFSECELFGRTLFRGKFGDLELLFCPKDLAGVDANINTIQVRFIIEDVAAAVAAGVNCAGVETINEPQLQDGELHASLRDPDGNSLELKQRSPANADVPK